MNPQSLASTLVIVFGTAHLASTPLFCQKMDRFMLGYVGAGLALIHLALLNLASARSPGRRISPLCKTANVLQLLYCVLVLAVFPEIQSLVALGLIAFLAGSARLAGSTKARELSQPVRS